MTKAEIRLPDHTLNHSEIAGDLTEKELGSILTYDIPEGCEFSDSDFFKINTLFRRQLGMPVHAGITDITSPDFMLFAYQRSLVVYKDTTWNLALFRHSSDAIGQILQEYPDAYPQIMNALTTKIPPSEREEFGFLPVIGKRTPNLVYNLDPLPPSVIKALRQLIADPDPKRQ